MSDLSQAISGPNSPSTRKWMVFGFSVFMILLFLLSPTSLALGKMGTVAYAVCHRIPERSFFFNGRQLPLCARCSGTFLGVLLTLITLAVAGRSRCGRFPPLPVTVVLSSFIFLWAFDGLNSYLTLIPGAPYLYEPQNWLRLTTGMLNGLALGVFVFSVFQFSAWRAPRQRTALQGLPELAGLVLLGALVVGLVLTGDPRLFIPLALASTLGVVVMLTIVNSIIVLIVAQRENSIQTWRDAGLPFFIALALSLAIIMAIGAGRATLTAAFEIPF